MKVCFIGLGSIGTRHCVNLHQICKEKGIPLNIHAVRSSDRPLKEALQNLQIHSVTSYDQMDRDYDAIFITNPTSMHYETLLKVGERAKGFFIEKPVFERPEEEVRAIPLQDGAVCYVAAPLRYTGVVQMAEKLVQEHQVYSARAISSSYLPDWRPGVDYRTTYSAHRDLGGGVSIDLIHEWDYLTMLFGMPNCVYSAIGTYSHLEIDSDDLAVYIGVYPDKLVEVHLDYFGRKTVRKLELLTEVGCYTCDIAESQVECPDGSIIPFQEKLNDRYLNEMKYFLSILENGQIQNTNTMEHAAAVLKLTRGAL